MIQRPDIRTQAESLIRRTTDETTRSKVLDALGRFNRAATADHYDALYDLVANEGKPPLVGSLAAVRDQRIAG